MSHEQLTFKMDSKLKDRLTTFVFLKNKYKPIGKKILTRSKVIHDAITRYLLEEELVLRKETRYIDAPIWDIDKEENKENKEEENNEDENKSI